MDPGLVAVDDGETGTDDLLTADPAGTITDLTYQAGTGFTAEQVFKTVDAPAPGTAIVAGDFVTDTPRQLLTTATDGTTVLQDPLATEPTPPTPAVIDTAETAHPDTDTVERRHPTAGRNL